MLYLALHLRTLPCLNFSSQLNTTAKAAKSCRFRVFEGDQMSCKYDKNSSFKLQREEMKAIFREHDFNGDGHLSIQELSRAFGTLTAFIPRYRAVCGFFIADADGDGFINEQELEKVVDYAIKCKYNII